MNVFAYVRYRRLLEDWLKSEEGPGRKSDLAADLGMTRAHLTNILKGRRQLDPSYVPTLGRLMSLGPDELEQLHLT